MSGVVETRSKRELKRVFPVILAWRHTRERWIVVDNLASIYVRNAELWYPPFTGRGDYEVLFIHGLPFIFDAVVRRNHDVVIEWYDGVRNRINIDGFAVVAVLYPGNYVLIHSRCCGSNKIMVFDRFKQLIEGIKGLSISDRDREFLIKAIKNRELVFG
jgi:hypothetical protein